MTPKKFELTPAEAWRVYELIEELQRFLHQHDPQPKDLERWLTGGVYRELSDVYYKVLSQWFPVDEESGEVLPPEGVVRRFPNR